MSQISNQHLLKSPGPHSTCCQMISSVLCGTRPLLVHISFRVFSCFSLRINREVYLSFLFFCLQRSTSFSATSHPISTTQPSAPLQPHATSSHLSSSTSPADSPPRAWDYLCLHKWNFNKCPIVACFWVQLHQLIVTGKSGQCCGPVQSTVSLFHYCQMYVYLVFDMYIRILLNGYFLWFVSIKEIKLNLNQFLLQIAPLPRRVLDYSLACSYFHNTVCTPLHIWPPVMHFYTQIQNQTLGHNHHAHFFVSSEWGIL